MGGRTMTVADVLSKVTRRYQGLGVGEASGAGRGHGLFRVEDGGDRMQYGGNADGSGDHFFGHALFAQGALM